MDIERATIKRRLDGAYEVTVWGGGFTENATVPTLKNAIHVIEHGCIAVATRRAPAFTREYPRKPRPWRYQVTGKR